MTLGVVIALLILGVLLILLEILFIPGTTVVGIGGLVLLGIGVFVAYNQLGNAAGHISLLSSVVVIFLSLVVLLKGQTWKRVALNDSIEARSVEKMDTLVAVGDRGRTISRLNPAGKAIFGETMVEVTASGEFVESDVEVEVTKVETNRVNVKTV
jgi:membrane-bound ClpP family serine protease